MSPEDRVSQMSATIATTVLSCVVTFTVDQVTGGMSTAQAAACIAVGCLSGFFGFAFGFSSGARSSKYPRPSRRVLRTFSRRKAQAARAALNADDMVAVGKYENAVLASVSAQDGVFIASAYMLGGFTSGVQEFTLSDSWRAFLLRKRNRELLERMCS